MSLLSMRVFGHDLLLELIPANQRITRHEDYEELAISVMSMVDLLVHKTSDMIQREREGHPDEGFLSEVSAQLPQAKEGEDKPGLEAMLLKVLQLYASSILSKRSCAKKAPEEKWNKILLNGMTAGKGRISPEEHYAVIKETN
ncbi:hypothetical protein D5086_018532 [Populus alba]|uniref:Uncharacterized protein n=2 Tax=Populus TaxID=3689 RepID=A0ACC4BQJ5_POPAL